MAGRSLIRRTEAQATPEWIALVLLVALLFLTVLSTAQGRVPGPALARQIAARMLCAARFSSACQYERDLTAAYGADTARLVREHVPVLAYEDGMVALPVDFRGCRASACADGPASGEVSRSVAGEPVTAFVHVVERDGVRWIQYWFYYADSATLRGVPVAGKRGYHADDWEAVQVRIGASGEVSARASSHHGYHQSGGVRSWGSDTGVAPGSGWGPESGWLFISGGSHAGSIKPPSPGLGRHTMPRDVRLVPLETLPGRDGYGFAISPPWLKTVWSDPEYEGT